MFHREITINGQMVAYYESRGNGAPVLFVHGNSMSGRSFEKQFNSILGETYRLIAIDLPGHGQSQPAQDFNSGYTLPGYAAIVATFVTMLEIDDATLVGWSLGGHVLLETSDYLPEATGLMIFGTPPAGKPIAAEAFIPDPLFPLSFKSDLTEKEMVAVTAGFFRSGCEVPTFAIEDMKRSDGRAREALGLSVAEANYADEVAVVANFNKPLAIVHGENESVANLSYLKSLAIPTLWRDEIQIIPNAGHTPQWEQPEMFNSLLMEFIEECR